MRYETVSNRNYFVASLNSVQMDEFAKGMREENYPNIRVYSWVVSIFVGAVLVTNNSATLLASGTKENPANHEG